MFNFPIIYGWAVPLPPKPLKKNKYEIVESVLIKADMRKNTDVKKLNKSDFNTAVRVQIARIMRKNEYTLQEIADTIGRDHSAVIYLLNKYQESETFKNIFK